VCAILLDLTAGYGWVRSQGKTLQGMLAPKFNKEKEHIFKATVITYGELVECYGRPCMFVCIRTGTLERLEVAKKAEVEVE